MTGNERIRNYFLLWTLIALLFSYCSSPEETNMDNKKLLSSKAIIRSKDFELSKPFYANFLEVEIVE